MKCSDEEVQQAFDHYFLLGTVEEAIDQVKLGVPLQQDTVDTLLSEGIDIDDLIEEFTEDGER